MVTEMKIQTHDYLIYIESDPAYTIDSVDNRFYDVVYNPQEIRKSSFYQVLAITIDRCSGVVFRIALIGDGYTKVENCAVLEADRLTVLMNKTVVQLDAASGALLRSAEIDCFGCNYAIYRVHDGYIIHGELQITMLDPMLNKKWDFTGRSIFVSQSGKCAFEICGDVIKLNDYDDNYYEIDLDGKLLAK